MDTCSRDAGTKKDLDWMKAMLEGAVVKEETDGVNIGEHKQSSAATVFADACLFVTLFLVILKKACECFNV